jgi:ferritin-like metal-binding protein YciE
MIINAQGDADVKDAAIIGAAQKVEHFEMAAYGTARSHALEAGLDDVAELLQESLDEEGDEDEMLTQEAESEINVKAAHKSR